MTTKPPSDQPPLNYALAERWLRADLTNLREQTGLTRIEVCRDTGISIRTLQRIENGPTPVAADNVAILCQYYGTSREHEIELQRLRHYSQKTGWWSTYHDVLGTAYAEHCEAEQQAAQMDFCGDLLPGILQTKAYAQHVQAQGALANTGEHAERLVSLRLQRHQEFLRGPKHRLRVLLELHGIRRQFFAPVLDEQVRLLHELQDQGYIDLRFEPTGVLTDFTLFTFADTGKRQRLLVCCNGHVDDVHVEATQRVTQFKSYFDRVWEHAAPLNEVSI